MKEQIIKECGIDVYDFISKYVDLNSENSFVVSTSTSFNIEYYSNIKSKGIVNLRKINDIRYINKFLEAVNDKLLFGGMFIGCAETKDLRKIRILRKYPIVINWIVYTIDFIIKRVLPKFGLTKKIYFFLTRGQNRVLARAEALGRMYSCGFEIIEEKFIDNLFYFVGKKIKEPAYDEDPSYGPLVKLKRIGKNGKIIKVYKLRTMHPFAEYLQEYIYKKNDLKEGGKFNDDFRITTLGRFFRKFWLDELPMFLNLFLGDIKLVGVRPLSSQYFNLYSEKLQQKRIKFKPGLFPPYYADMPKTLEEIEKSELNYLTQYEKNPFITDLKYFFKALYNIIFKRHRSQ